MNYHNITKSDMLNGDGLRAVLWLAGCEHHCFNCQNPITWNPDGGILFDDKAKEELFSELEKDYISGITFSGGDPLHPSNRYDVGTLMMEIKDKYPNKTIWLYSGYEFEDILNLSLMNYVDVLVCGKFVEELKNVNYPWAGSTNQRIIDVKKSLEKGDVVIHENY